MSDLHLTDFTSTIARLVLAHYLCIMYFYKNKTYLYVQKVYFCSIKQNCIIFKYAKWIVSSKEYEQFILLYLIYRMPY